MSSKKEGQRFQLVNQTATQPVMPLGQHCALSTVAKEGRFIQLRICNFEEHHKVRRHVPIHYV